MNQEPQGEAATPPPEPVDYTATPPAATSKPWPILLAQAMRGGTYVNAQVALVGTVECRSPDPTTLLRIGGRWQVTHRALRSARAALSDVQQAQITAYVQRDARIITERTADGTLSARSIPPEMQDGEPVAFAALWRELRRRHVMSRCAPRQHEGDTDERD